MTAGQMRYHKSARIASLGGESRGLDEWGSSRNRKLAGNVLVLAAGIDDLPAAEVYTRHLRISRCTVPHQLLGSRRQEPAQR
jgi:hypothetical protein